MVVWVTPNRDRQTDPFTPLLGGDLPPFFPGGVTMPPSRPSHPPHPGLPGIVFSHLHTDGLDYSPLPTLFCGPLFFLSYLLCPLYLLPFPQPCDVFYPCRPHPTIPPPAFMPLDTCARGGILPPAHDRQTPWDLCVTDRHMLPTMHFNICLVPATHLLLPFDIPLFPFTPRSIPHLFIVHGPFPP